MKNLQEIMNSFHAEYHAQQLQSKVIKKKADSARAAAQRYQSIAARKMGEYHKLLEKSYRVQEIGWVDGLLRPLLVEIESRTGWEFDNKNDLRTFGLRAECPVYIWDGTKDEYGYKNFKAYIVFTSDIKRDEEGFYTHDLYFDTGEITCEYPAGSIADLNHFGRKVEKVESVEQVIEFLQKQMSN